MSVLRKDLQALGASDVEIIIFEADPQRANAAIDAAEGFGADNIVRYALKLFEDPSFKARKPARGANLNSYSECQTCGGDRFVVVGTRPPMQSMWMYERGIQPTGEGIEEVAPCPDCGTELKPSRRYDGTMVVPLDPAAVREKMNS